MFFVVVVHQFHAIKYISLLSIVSRRVESTWDFCDEVMCSKERSGQRKMCELEWSTWRRV